MENKKETVPQLLKQIKDAHAKKDPKLVIKLCERVLVKNAKNIYAYLFKGQALFQMKSYLQAEQCYLTGIEFVDPTDKTYYQYIKGLREIYFSSQARGSEEEDKIEDMDQKQLLNF